ncbi:MAG: ATP-binding protein [Candidatus Coatesbacteria bacterium]
MLREPPPKVQPPEVEREVARAIPPSTAQAVVLTGVRRCGKSTLLAQLLRRAGASVSLNFEDTRLYGMGPQDFPTVLSLVDELPRSAAVGLDEVQEVPEWQRLVRALLDRRRMVLLTGSNASLLGRELGAKLTGRHLSFEVRPFDYSEYLDWARRLPGETSLREWLDLGGFPGYLRERNDNALRELLRDVIARDIASRHGLREIRHLLNLTLFLLANTGRPFSLQRLTRSLSIPTVGQTSHFVEYLQDAYLIMACPKFSPSFRSRVVAPPKYYAVDNGLRRANSPQGMPDLGHRLENAVFLELRARGASPAWAGEADRWECDFVTGNDAIQVCAELTEGNKARELAGLIRGAALPGARRRQSLVITIRQSDHLRIDGLPVTVIPAWKWLTEPR